MTRSYICLIDYNVSLIRLTVVSVVIRLYATTSVGFSNIIETATVLYASNILYSFSICYQNYFRHLLFPFFFHVSIQRNKKYICIYC